MTKPFPLSFLRARRFVLLITMSAMLCPLSVQGDGTVENPDWELCVSDFGYSDIALDKRRGFAGREYLSGEWAAAIHYRGGESPPGPIWLEPNWVFPDWDSNSNFNVEKPFQVADESHPVNMDGFEVFQSVISNPDVRIAINYEMLDSVDGIAQGNTPRSSAQTGAHLRSTRYVLKQTYRITNISGGALSDISLFQFLHGLHASKSIFDDRDYGGPMGAYRHDSTQLGDSYSIHTEDGTIVLHHDTLAFHSQMPPAAWEVGYFGRKDLDSHEIGKPEIGVHLNVEADTLSGTDFFEPPEGGWVSAVQKFDLGDLPAGASVSHHLLLTVQTIDEVKFPGINIVVRNLERRGDHLVIEFEETIGGPLAFTLLKATTLDVPEWEWEWLDLPYIKDPLRPPGWSKFEVPIDESEPKAFFRIAAFIKN